MLTNNKFALLLMLASGILCPVAFAGIDIWPLAFISFVPMIIALHNKPPKQAFLMSLFMGMVSMTIGFYWLVGMLEMFSGFSMLWCILFATIIWLHKAGMFALCGWLYARASQLGYRNGLVFSIAYVISELVYPLLFPWYFAAALHQVPIMLQLADIGGPILISFMIVLVNAAIAEVVLKIVYNKYFYKLSRTTVAFGLMFPIIAYLYGSYKINIIDQQLSSLDTIKVGMVQSNMPMGNGKFTNSQRNRPIELTQKLNKQQNIDLVVWAETGSGQTFNSNNYLETAKDNLTGLLGVPAIVGVNLYEKLSTSKDGKQKYMIYNTALMSNKDGVITGRYDKHLLLIFGEYIPLGDIFPVLYDISQNSGRFGAGSSFTPFNYQGHNISVNICYEDIMPGFVNQQVRAAKPELLVNITNDTWYGDTTEPWQHLALAKFRAIEHHKYLIRVTNSGVTAIIDPIGRVSELSDLFVAQAMVGDISFMKGRSVYSYIGNWPWWLLTAGFLYILFSKKHRRVIHL